MLQFTALSQLRELVLFSTAHAPDSQAGLSVLAGSLTALELHECGTAPLTATLASLTNLVCLTVIGLHTGTPLAGLEATVVHALPVLQRLTRLELVFEEPTRLPQALAHAPELRELSLYSGAEDVSLPHDCELPAGPWPQLQQLEASWPRLRGSVASLHGMGLLERLNINSHPWPPWPIHLAAWDAFWAWAASCQTLSSLFIWWCQNEGMTIRTTTSFCAPGAPSTWSMPCCRCSAPAQPCTSPPRQSM